MRNISKLIGMFILIAIFSSSLSAKEFNTDYCMHWAAGAQMGLKWKQKVPFLSASTVEKRVRSQLGESKYSQYSNEQKSYMLSGALAVFTDENDYYSDIADRHPGNEFALEINYRCEKGKLRFE